MTFGIQAPPAVNRSVRRSRQTLDYLTLNDGLEDDEVSSPKPKKRTTYRPGSGPSATRQAASKHTVSPESKSALKSKTTGTLPAVPVSTSTSSNIIVPEHALTGILDEQKLPGPGARTRRPEHFLNYGGNQYRRGDGRCGCLTKSW